MGFSIFGTVHFYDTRGQLIDSSCTESHKATGAQSERLSIPSGAVSYSICVQYDDITDNICANCQYDTDPGAYTAQNNDNITDESDNDSV